MKQDVIVCGVVYSLIIYDSVEKYVMGQVDYIDDLMLFEGMLYVYLGFLMVVYGCISCMDLDVVCKVSGVYLVLMVDDIFGVNDISLNGLYDDLVFVFFEVQFYGQLIFVVIVEICDQVWCVCKLVKLDYEELFFVLDVMVVCDVGMGYVMKFLMFLCGDMVVLDVVFCCLDGWLMVGGQEYFYLESQIVLVIFGEDDEVVLYILIQYLIEVQYMVVYVLYVLVNVVVVNVWCMGGGFGGKEMQMNFFCCVVVFVVKWLKWVVKLCFDRDDDFVIIGKWYDFVIDYDVGYDDIGCIYVVSGDFYVCCGFLVDLLGLVMDRVLFYVDNVYYYLVVELCSYLMKMNICLNIVFCGFGGL